MTNFRERHPERSNAYVWPEAMEFYEKRLDEAAEEIDRLRATLKQIAKSSLMPTDFEWSGIDAGGFYYASYKTVGLDGVERTYSVDDSNNGDIHNHGYEQGLHHNAAVARAVLTPDKGTSK